MKITTFLLLTAGSASLAFGGKLPPLGVKDVSLMLRSGYSAAAVQQEIASRHFIDPIDATAEKSLSQAGAPAALVAALKSGVYGIPAGEVAAAREEMAAQANRRAQQGEEARRLNTLYQSRQAQAKPTSATASPLSNAIAPLVKAIS